MLRANMQKIWFSSITILVIIVIPIRVVVSYNDKYGEFSAPLDRALNVFGYFTNTTNMLCATLAFIFIVKRGRISNFINSLFLSAVVSIIVVAVVYYSLLASTEHLTGISVYTNIVVHAIVPAMFTLGWIFFIQHGATTIKSVKLALIYPIGWAVFAMIRGAVIHYYPYPFMDVTFLGYAKALINMGVITLFFIGLFFGAHFLDKKIQKN